MSSSPLPGQATIMARYMNSIATCQVIIPHGAALPDEEYNSLPQNNYIDPLVWSKLRQLNLKPSAPIADEKFLRRVYLDVIGRLPTPTEIRQFLADTATDRRSRLIDQLLQRPEFADHWASKWMDLLRPNPYRVGIKAVLNYDNWIRDSFRKNKPYDQFVRELVTAEGSTWNNGASTFYRDRRSPDEQATMVSQLFLGIRLECAKCHHHPFEKWSQRDFYSFAAFFARVGRKGRGLSPPISGSEEIIMNLTKGSVSHPLTGESLEPKPLFGELDFDDQKNWREQLAQWITSRDNDYFAQVMANRVWADLMGLGIVEPVDDLRMTNPPSNEPLLNALAADFRANNYDLKHLIRSITNSHVYSISSIPNDRNAADTRNYSRHYRRQMSAEVMLDAISDITDIPTKFSGMPVGSRANQVWTHRVPSTFLDTFGRPDMNQDPPCERTRDSTVTQVLHRMNDRDLNRRIESNEGRSAELEKSSLNTDQLVDEIYLLTFGRFPAAAEKSYAGTLFIRPDSSRRQTIEDLLWASLNSAEFVFID